MFSLSLSQVSSTDKYLDWQISQLANIWNGECLDSQMTFENLTVLSSRSLISLTASFRTFCHLLNHQFSSQRLIKSRSRLLTDVFSVYILWINFAKSSPFRIIWGKKYAALKKGHHHRLLRELHELCELCVLCDLFSVTLNGNILKTKNWVLLIQLWQWQWWQQQYNLPSLNYSCLHPPRCSGRCWRQTSRQARTWFIIMITIKIIIIIMVCHQMCHQRACKRREVHHF